MGDDYCASDQNCSNDNNYAYNDTTTNENTTIPTEEVVHSSNVVVDEAPRIDSTFSENFYIGDCYDEGFPPPPPPLYNVGIESIAIGGGCVDPYYGADFHTIPVGGIQPCYAEPCYTEQHVYPVFSPDDTIPTWARIAIFIILLTMLAAFVVMGKFQLLMFECSIFILISFCILYFQYISVLLFIYL